MRIDSLKELKHYYQPISIRRGYVVFKVYNGGRDRGPSIQSLPLSKFTNKCIEEIKENLAQYIADKMRK